jgi:transcriptional regulator with PAS, ATPase and Fis domain
MFEREIIYKFLGDLKREVSELKKIVTELKNDKLQPSNIRPPIELTNYSSHSQNQDYTIQDDDDIEDIHIGDHVVIDDQYSLIDAEKDLIKKALEKHNNKRKLAADELGISERTLYRKIREYGIS